MAGRTLRERPPWLPNRVLGRVWASKSFIGMGIVPVGALIGGILGEGLGIPMTIVIGACGGVPSFLWVLFSPVRTIRTLPALSDAQEGEVADSSERSSLV